MDTCVHFQGIGKLYFKFNFSMYINKNKSLDTQIIKTQLWGPCKDINKLFYGQAYGKEDDSLGHNLEYLIPTEASFNIQLYRFYFVVLIMTL